MFFLSTFETTEDPAIVDRGRDYFRQGRVCGLEEVVAGQWQARVEGTDDYTVTVELDEDTIVDATCTCPYDFGPVCKHVVSVLLSIEAQRNGKPLPVAKSQPVRRKLDATKRQQVPGILDHPTVRLAPSLLRQLVSEAAERDPYIANRIKLVQQEAASSPLSKSELRRMIRASFREARERDGYVSWDRTDQAAEGAAQLVAEAETLIEAKRFDQAIPILETVVAELVPALQGVDDSDGVVGGLIEEAFQLLEVVVNTLRDPVLRANCFTYWLREAGDRRYDGWDWQWSWLELASRLVESDEQQAALLTACDRLTGREKRHAVLEDYDAERAAVIKVSVLERRGTGTMLYEFLSQHRSLPAIRTKLLGQAEANRDSRRIRDLASEGMALSEENKLPGLTIEWTKWLLRASELDGNQAEIRERTEELFLKTGDWTYYDHLKATYSNAEWREQALKLLGRMGGNQYYRVNSIHQRGELCVREELWDELLRLLDQWLARSLASMSQFPVIDRFHRYLASRFPEKLAELYERAVHASLDGGSIPPGRAAYQESARMLRRMKNLGTTNRVEQLVKVLCEKYPRRRAMVEELRRVTGT